MPAKGSSWKTGPRNLILCKEFYDTVRQQTKLELSDKEIREIILESNKEMANIVANSDDVLKLPEDLGYIAVTKYKSKKRPVDWIATRKVGKRVLALNLHSFDYIYHIKWFKTSGGKFGIKKVYRLEPTRLLKRTVAKNVKIGKTYHTWDVSDFWNMSKLYNRINKENE